MVVYYNDEASVKNGYIYIYIYIYIFVYIYHKIKNVLKYQNISINYSKVITHSDYFSLLLTLMLSNKIFT